MPDPNELHWSPNPKESAIIKESDHEHYTIYLYEKKKDQMAFDDLTLETVDCKVALVVEILNGNLFMTLDPTRLSEYLEDLDNKKGASVDPILSNETGTVCQLCETPLPAGLEVLSLTEGWMSVTMELSCWSELINSCSDLIERTGSSDIVANTL